MHGFLRYLFNCVWVASRVAEQRKTGSWGNQEFLGKS